MPPWLPVVVAVLIAALSVTANAIISTTVKFAPDADTAGRELKRMASLVVSWLATIAVGVSLAYQVTRSGFATKIDVLLIAAQVAVLLFAAMVKLLLRLIDRYTHDSSVSTIS